MRRLILCALLAVAAVAGAITQTTPAGAYFANQPWIAGYPMANIFPPPEGYMCTTGPQMLSTVNLHVYQVIPRHCIEYAYGVNTWIDNSASPGNTVAARYMNAQGNNFEPSDMWYPYGNSGGVNYALFDMAIYDIGSVVNSIPDSDLVKNWCHAYPNCSGPLSGGTGAATFGQGYHMQTAGQATPWVGMLACHSGMISGTACGYVNSAHLISYNGYSTWVWKVTGIGNCGVATGDSGAPVYWTEDAQNVYQAGMVVNFFDPWTTTSQSSCYAAGRSISNQSGFIPWTSIANGYPGLGLVPYT
jgi:hypothetical protein